MLRMRQERIRRGWTQGELGEKVGVTKQTINDIEKGRSGPGYKVLVRLEDLFGLSHRELLADVPEKDACEG